jgi:hypothetical protein
LGPQRLGQIRADDVHLGPGGPQPAYFARRDRAAADDDTFATV